MSLFNPRGKLWCLCGFCVGMNEQQGDHLLPGIVSGVIHRSLRGRMYVYIIYTRGNCLHCNARATTWSDRTYICDTQGLFINSLVPGDVEITLPLVFYRWVAQTPIDDQSTWVQFMAWKLVTSGNKPLPDPMVTHIYVAMWRHWATMN